MTVITEVLLMEGKRGPLREARKLPEIDFQQMDAICKCGMSWYTVGGRCNRCGIERSRKEPVKGSAFFNKKRSPRKVWNKKKHCYDCVS